MKFLFMSVFISNLLFFIPEVKSMVIEAQSMMEIKPYLEKTKLTTFVFFDVDMVLIQPSDPSLQIPNILRYLDTYKQLTTHLTPEEKDILLHHHITGSTPILVDDLTPEIVQRLHEEKIPTFGLTAAFTGPFSEISNIQKWRHDILKNLGISFNVNYEDTYFTELQASRAQHPCLYQGVIYANGEQTANTKGDVLITFLKYIDTIPKQIIFIDDRRINLDHVESALQKHYPEIDFIGLNYLGARHYPAKNISFETFQKRWSALLNLTKNY